MCPLCNAPACLLFQIDPFLRCSQCFLIFKNPRSHLDALEEKARYSTHKNNIENLGYVNFLIPVVEEIKKTLPPGATGLDYGCGPGPVLAAILNQCGFITSHYDPYFFPELNHKTKELDFITCTEAAEHFFNPGIEFKKMFSLLNPQGALVLMTETYVEGSLLKDWYYPRDPTHVCFYSETTLKWLAQTFHKQLRLATSRIAVFS